MKVILKAREFAKLVPVKNGQNFARKVQEILFPASLDLSSNICTKSA